MTISLYSNLAKTVLNLVEIAKEQGLSYDKQPVKILIQGSMLQSDLAAPCRYVYIAYNAPVITTETILWLDATSNLMYVADPSAKVFNQVFEYSDMFAAGASSSSSGSGSGSTGGSTVAATRPPVQALEDLAAVSTTSLPDKSIIYVENERTLYAYDAESIDAGEGIIAPESGVGRWIAIAGLAANLDGGNF